MTSGFYQPKNSSALNMSAPEEEASREDIKTVKGILALKDNDELKFGLLIGLIELQQVSNKDVVDTVLYLVSKNRSQGLFLKICRPVQQLKD